MNLTPHRRSLLQAVLDRGEPLSRYAIAKTTGINKAVVGRIVSDLIDAGLLIESKRRSTHAPPVKITKAGHALLTQAIEAPKETPAEKEARKKALHAAVQRRWRAKKAEERRTVAATAPPAAPAVKAPVAKPASAPLPTATWKDGKLIHPGPVMPGTRPANMSKGDWLKSTSLPSAKRAAA